MLHVYSQNTNSFTILQRLSNNFTLTTLNSTKLRSHLNLLDAANTLEQSSLPSCLCYLYTAPSLLIWYASFYLSPGIKHKKSIYHRFTKQLLNKNNLFKRNCLERKEIKNFLLFYVFNMDVLSCFLYAFFNFVVVK